MVSIHTNLSSLIAQGSLTKSTNTLNRAIEQMSTGYKINHASDNAANYSIKTNMDTKIGAYQVAEENAMMGLDMLQTAESSLNQISDKLSRLRALAVTAQNGTYGDQSKAAINAEANALVDEIERLRDGLLYNGKKILSKGENSVDMPVEVYNGFVTEVLQRSVSGMQSLSTVDETQVLTDGSYSISTCEDLEKLSRMTKAGLISSGDEFVLANDIDMSQVKDWTPIGFSYNENYFNGTFDGNGYAIKGFNISTDEKYQYDFAGYGFFGTIRNATIKNLKFEDFNIEARNRYYVGVLSGLVYNSQIKNCTIEGSNLSAITAGLVVGEAQGCNISECYVNDSQILGFNVGGIASRVAGNNSVLRDCYINSEIIGTNDVGGLIGQIGTTYTFEFTNCYVLSYTSNLTGIFHGSTTPNKDGYVSLTNCYYNSNYDDALLYGIHENGNIYLTSTNVSNIDPLEVINNDLLFQVGIDSDESNNITFDSIFNLSVYKVARMLGIINVDIGIFDKAITQVAQKQTELGATQNRLMSVLEEINVQYENLVSSRSTIQDADMSEVSATYIQQQILQQASATLMATANQTPAIALQLI